MRVSFYDFPEVTPQDFFVSLDLLLLVLLESVLELVPEIPVVLLIGAEIIWSGFLGSPASSYTLETLNAHDDQNEETIGAYETNYTPRSREHGLVPLILLALNFFVVQVPIAHNQRAKDYKRNAKDEIHGPRLCLEFSSSALVVRLGRASNFRSERHVKEKKAEENPIEDVKDF